MARAATKKRPVPAGPLFTPNPGPQQAFVDCACDEVLFGGMAGGGKSLGLLIGAYAHLLQYGFPGAKCLILRRTLTETRQQSFFSMAAEKFSQLTGLGVTWNGSTLTWSFPGKGEIVFGFLDNETDRYRYQGAEYLFIGFDEATHFVPSNVTWMVSRLRGPEGVPCLLRFTSNPGGPSHRFFFERYAPWLDRRPEYLEAAAAGIVPLADPGEVLWFVTKEEGGKVREVYVPAGTENSKSRTYIPASYRDTPQLDQARYRANLLTLDPITRAQQMHGDWTAEDSQGSIFKREWFGAPLPTIPSSIRRWVRSWDMAWGLSDDAAWSVGLLLGEAPEGWYLCDLIRLRGTEGTTRPLIRRIAELDGKHVTIRLPDDSGKAGVDLRTNYVRDLAGFDVRLLPDRGDKFERAKPVAAQCEQKHVFLVKSHPSRAIAQELAGKGVQVSSALGWHEDFLAELVALDPRKPSAGFKDQLDALTGAFNYLTDRPMPTAEQVRGTLTSLATASRELERAWQAEEAVF